MKLLELTVEGFRSFGAEQRLDFSVMEPGLYHVTGMNHVEPELEANGVGKSSLFEAVFWVLFGKTSRNLRAAAIKNWHYSGKCRVTLAFEQHDTVYLLIRAWNPNKLILQKESNKPEEIMQEKLDELIGLTPEAFLCAMYFAQLVPSFVDLSPSDRMSLYSSVLQLDEWEARSENTTLYASKLHQQQITLTQEIANEDGRLHELTSQNWTVQERQWNTTKAIELEEAKKLEKEEMDKLRRLEHAKLNPVGDKEQREFSRLNAELQQVNRELDQITRLKTGVCITCNQKVTGQHLEQERRRLHARKLKLTMDTAAAEKRANLESILRQQLANTNAEIASCKGNIRFYGEQITRLRTQGNPYTKSRLDSEAKVAERQAVIKQKQEELDETESLHKAVSFWTKGFKDIRLLLIEESLSQLNIEVNECLYQLGLRDWTIRFETEQETKAKTIKKGFTCLISAPGVDSAPWEAWSGGESQRLRVAISMGVSNLITSRTGLSPSVETWDEPSSWLSESGIAGLLTALRERAILQNKVILLADHRALEFGGFRDIIQLEKTQEGSRLL